MYCEGKYKYITVCIILLSVLLVVPISYQLVSFWSYNFLLKVPSKLDVCTMFVHYNYN